MQLSNIGLYIVGAFLLINLALGLWAGKDVKDIRDYAVGNKKWSTGALVMTYIATIFGGGFVFLDSKGYYYNGIGSLIACMGIPISQLIRSLFLAKKFGDISNLLTIGDFIEKFYGKYAKILSGFLGFVFNFITLATQIKILGVIFEQFLGLDPFWAIVICGLIVTVYSSFGGISSIVSTDILQFVFLIAALFLMSSLAISKAGGVKNIFLSLPSDRLEIINNPKFPYFISLFLINALFQNEMVHPARFQRLLMAKSAKGIKKMFLFCAILSAIIFGMLAMMSYAAVIIYPDCNGDFILTIFKEILPDHLKPFIIIGLISIVFSSADSFLHSATLSLGVDFISPIVSKKNLSVKYLSYSSMIIGFLAIIAAFYEFVLSRSMLILAILAPLLSSPTLLAILGIKISKKFFWIASAITVIFFTISEINLLGSFFNNFSVILATALNLSSLLFLRAYEKISKKKFLISNFYITRNKSQSFFRKKKDFSLKKLINLTKVSIQLHKPNFVLFASFYCAILLLPYLLSSTENSITMEFLVYFKLVSLILCSLLITHSIWPKVCKPYLPAFWYITLTYCLPFLSIIMLLLTKGAIEYTINIAINIMFLLLLVDWTSAIGIAIFGTLTAVAYYKFFLQIDHNENIFNFETIYLLVYQVIFGSVIGLLFARKKHIKLRRLDTLTNFTNRFKRSIIESNQRSLKIVEDSNKSHFRTEITPQQSLEDIKKILTENEYKKIANQLQTLETFVASEAVSISPYFVLNVQDIEISVLIEEFTKFCKSIGCEEVSVFIYSKKTKIQCDPIAILKVLAKLIADYCKKAKENDDDDIYINVTINDTILSYFDNNREFIRGEDAINIIITDSEFFNDELQKSVFNKDLIDPKLIPRTEFSDNEMIDIEHTVDAHYGMLEKSKAAENFAWACVLPVKVYDIRPITLDLPAPTKTDLSYEWPAADELEAMFLEKLKKFNIQIDENKLHHALDVIKIYHRHQMRKSGEPYYIHPINVAMITIDLMVNKDAAVYELLQKHQESVILASLLHDILEDTYYKKKNLLNDFGSEVLKYVESVTKSSYETRQYLLENKDAFRAIVEKEPITIIIKLADRMHNIMTIDGHSKIEKRKAIADETLNFFVPPAKKLGLLKIAHELEEASNYVLKNGKIEGYY